MSGHSKWSQIKHKKAATDQRRGEVFSKIIQAITAAAKEEPNPDFNPRLRTLVEKAKANNVPQKNIERALKGAEEKETEELTIEAYGPGGVAIIIKATTDSRNRTISEIRHILSKYNSKIAESGSVLWAFDQEKPKFPQRLSPSDRERLTNLLNELENRPDVIKTLTNLPENI